jgi:hypothetical protein
MGAPHRSVNPHSTAATGVGLGSMDYTARAVGGAGSSADHDMRFIMLARV